MCSVYTRECVYASVRVCVRVFLYGSHNLFTMIKNVHYVNMNAEVVGRRISRTRVTFYSYVYVLFNRTIIIHEMTTAPDAVNAI